MPLSRKTKKAARVLEARKNESNADNYSSQMRSQELPSSRSQRLNSLKMHASQMPLSRKTKKATHVSEARKNELLENTIRRKLKDKDNQINRRKSQSLQSKLENRMIVKKRAESLRKKENAQKKLKRLQNAKNYISQMRSQESPSSRSLRLNSLKTHASQMRSFESQTSIVLRLESMRSHASQVRDLESPSTRESRLELMRSHASQVRDLESPSTRESRLELMRSHASQVRDLESPSTRESRLELMKNHVSQARDLESPSTRESRLDLMRSHASQVRDLESPSTRESRLESMRSHASENRASETPTTRVRRQQSLQIHRQRTIHARRILFETGEDEFNKAISEINEHQSSLLMFITGGAGSGKSFTLKLLVEQIRRLSTNTSCVAITAPTGVAARLVKGCTLHSTFILPIEKGQAVALRPLTGDRLQRERTKWRTIEWVIIDEISMVPYSTLRNIHLRLQELKQNTLIFGGVNLLVFGDLMQLPPVSATRGGAYCFKQPEILAAEPHLWRMFSFCELSQNMRQANDNSFVDLLNSIRVGKLSMEQLAMLDTRRIINETNQYDEIVHIFPTLKQVDQYNTKMSERLALRTKVYTIKAIDTSTESKTYGQVPKQEHIPSDPNRTGGIISSIDIGIGSRVMLRRNLNINRGLVSGAMGVVRNLVWPALRRDQLEHGEQPSAVLIQFDDCTINADEDGLVRIEPCVTEFDGLRGSGKIQRKMLPLILTWAVTVHKLQGCTLDKAVIDLGKSLFAKGQAYVAISRIRSLDGLFICSLDHNKLLKNPHDSRSLEELERLRNLSNFLT